ncbi:protein UPSTREAM OF FLC isoform X1 [Brachypodium distachyon]|uniref:protein UPSTREAM OF FLC isoform X1 n=1 Tax=Brachypodium distachyon TaxID=15368 RepID=UPI00052FFFBD|nr:protein UPSTREAM OF FLC isoform X1 [Brachypodium distachyon]XP_024312980.1 protein UPSTREAM OF FLC isoform X1 [Brachypodium distachyon]|eukprot:XP_010231361.1 protein UPSTREAM OF FLC isoform X1 [Brachypodium distachyon]
MESRGRRPRSPERQRPAARKVPVVYYLTRSRHLEHPHFVEVPVSSSTDGLCLRDVINHLNMVRGKGMAAMYSWSCKRSYKNGFVWHDLAEDDLVIPATDGEYVLKGSELLDQPSSGQFYHGSNGNQKQQSRLKEGAREASYSSSPPSVTVREAKPRRAPSIPMRDEDDSLLPCRVNSSENMSPESEEPQRTVMSRAGSASPAEFRVYKPTGLMDAATQTDDLGRRSARKVPEMHKKSLSTDHDSVVREVTEYRQQSHPRRSAELQGISRDVMSQCPTPLSIASTRGKSESLESLIRADNAMNSFRIIEEDDIVVPTCPKLRPANVLMQLITCGSLSVKDHDSIGLVGAYKPRFPNLKFPSPLISRSMMMGELDYLSENPRFIGKRLEDKEYFSGSIIETKMQREVPAERHSVLKRSSSYNAERGGETLDCARPDEEDTVSRSRCLPRTPILSSFLHPKSEAHKSPVSDCRRSSSAGQDSSIASVDGGSKRFTDASVAPARIDSFRNENKDKLVKIEERLSSGARVVIQCTVPWNDGDES